MFSYCVFILTSHPLFAENMDTLLQEQPGLESLGWGNVPPKTFSQIRSVAPDVCQ